MGLTHNWSCSRQPDVGSNSRTFGVCNPAGEAINALTRMLYCGLLYVVDFRPADHPQMMSIQLPAVLIYDCCSHN
ncbi:unnamed protein product [Malus baccata var. baccata]